ncbi:hypothetical protein [Chlorogloea sp. CCALA 695]|uniref:hypothetical protein n=1 Tax=Chlorogloea sp. CCALA 695 TaxID=2107693 RepID=UPI000D06AA48|nr:hypothetical protein [Chlorogloea sp. CCALA 695]PSB33498.1 hypothetical protein C7B70_06585 [Chlorogloea sp. CCALA 695]
MNTEESEQDLQRRLQELEVSLPTNTHPVATPSKTSNNSVAGLNQFISLFKSLPNVGKIIVVGVGTIVGFAILKSLLSLVATLFSLAFLGLIVYFGYQFLVARNSQKIEK